MNKYDKLTEDEVWNDLYPRIYLLIKKNQWESIGAVFGLGGGILSLVMGIVFEIVTWSLFMQSNNLYFKKVSFICFMMNLPLLTVGAHCLDLLEKKTSLSSFTQILSQ